MKEERKSNLAMNSRLSWMEQRERPSVVRGNADEQKQRELLVGLASIEFRRSLLVKLFHVVFKVSKRLLCALTAEVIRSSSETILAGHAPEVIRRFSKQTPPVNSISRSRRVERFVSFPDTILIKRKIRG